VGFQKWKPFKTKTMTEILIDKVLLPEGVVRYDLKVSDLPANFLGLATDIVFTGDMAKADYLGMQWGEVFDGLSATQRPINMVKALPDQGKLVMGITLKSNDLPTLRDGVLASFNFKHDVLGVTGVESPVFSTFDVARKDIMGVQWTISDAAKQVGGGKIAEMGGINVVEVEKGSEGTVVVDKSGVGPINSDLLLGNTTESNIYDESIIEALNTPLLAKEESFAGWSWLLLLFGILLVLTIGLALYLRKRFASKKPKDFIDDKEHETPSGLGGPTEPDFA
jgi:hypothetical protein